MRAEFARLCDEALAWPLPGAGGTRGRWSNLSALAESDLVVARLVEAHADAVAICAELTSAASPQTGSRWGVWAAEGLGASCRAFEGDDGWRIRGTKAWCSGATLLTHALVTAEDGQRRVLLAIDLAQRGIHAGDSTWAAEGMRRADTRTVSFQDARAELVAADASYLTRPGFWTGAIGVAACWYGGAAALGRTLRTAVGDRPADPHAAAHLGAVDVVLGTARTSLLAAANAVDGDPTADHRRLALRVRGSVARAASEVAARVGRALGPASYARNADHAQRVADLEVYVRQDHAERDLAVLGEITATADWDWSL